MGFEGMEVVGESYRIGNLHQIIRQYLGDVPQRGEIEVAAQLVPEPDNQNDPDAIAVYVLGLQVGYIPRDSTWVIQDAWVQAAHMLRDNRKWYQSKNIRIKWLEVAAVIGWSRPEVIGVRLTGIDEESGVMNCRAEY